MPRNTLRVHTEYVLIKSVVRKSCGLNPECRELENIALPFSSMPKMWRWYRHLWFPSGNFAELNSYCHLYGAHGQGQRHAYILPLATMNFVGLVLTTPDMVALATTTPLIILLDKLVKVITTFIFFV
ncbi:hypothetical protein TNCV_118671 [Trichonephila clavipes]|nr:hypothetical protein TNCV_118671 [Trichonephila clavipes]